MATQSEKLRARSQSRKRKVVPKVKVLLTNPLKSNIPKLPYNEVFELKDIIQSEVLKSGLPIREFAKQYKICLGFSSSMRQIGKKKSSCVLISQLIRPKFVIEQIGYYANQKNNSAPVYIVPSFEHLTVRLFGMKSLVMTFPLSAPGKIAEWISSRTKQGLRKQEYYDPHPHDPCNLKRCLDLNPYYLPREGKQNARSFIPPNVVKCIKKPDDAEDPQDKVGVINKNRKILGMTEFEKKKQLPKIVYEEWDEDFEFVGYRPIKSRYVYRNVHRRQRRHPKNSNSN